MTTTQDATDTRAVTAPTVNPAAPDPAFEKALSEAVTVAGQVMQGLMLPTIISTLRDAGR